MFNRKIVVDLVKKKDVTDMGTDRSETDFADKATITGVVIENAIKKVGFAVCAYVILDTVRKVVVANATA